jgi:hypothetical protein
MEVNLLCGRAWPARRPRRCKRACRLTAWIGRTFGKPTWSRSLWFLNRGRRQWSTLRAVRSAVLVTWAWSPVAVSQSKASPTRTGSESDAREKTPGKDWEINFVNNIEASMGKNLLPMFPLDRSEYLPGHHSVWESLGRSLWPLRRPLELPNLLSLSAEWYIHSEPWRVPMPASHYHPALVALWNTPSAISETLRDLA